MLAIINLNTLTPLPSSAGVDDYCENQDHSMCCACDIMQKNTMDVQRMALINLLLKYGREYLNRSLGEVNWTSSEYFIGRNSE